MQEMNEISLLQKYRKRSIVTEVNDTRVNDTHSILTKRLTDYYIRFLGKNTMGEQLILNSTIRSKKEENLSFTFNGKTHNITAPPFTVFGTYIKHVLQPLTEYLTDAYIVKYENEGKLVFCHGGLLCDFKSDGKTRGTHMNAVTSFMNADHIGKDIEFHKVENKNANEYHHYGFMQCTPITGRVPISEHSVPREELWNDHPGVKLFVVGHTPQPAGLPTVYKNRDQDQYLIELDTQYSPRKINNHCLAIDKNMNFHLKGQVKIGEVTVQYEARNTDPNIGTSFVKEDKLYIRTAKVLGGGPNNGKYIAVAYFDNLGKIVLYDGEKTDTVESETHIQNPSHIVCGDIEASFHFFQGFLSFAGKILNKNITCTLNKKNMSLSTNVREQLPKTTKIVCIGDVVGSPNPPFLKPPQTMEEEAAVVKFFGQNDIKIVGNREWNKLRLFEEMPHFYKDIKTWNDAKRNDDIAELHIKKENDKTHSQKKKFIASHVYGYKPRELGSPFINEHTNIEVNTHISEPKPPLNKWRAESLLVELSLPKKEKECDPDKCLNQALRKCDYEWGVTKNRGISIDLVPAYNKCVKNENEVCRENCNDSP